MRVHRAFRNAQGKRSDYALSRSLKADPIQHDAITQPSSRTSSPEPHHTFLKHRALDTKEQELRLLGIDSASPHDGLSRLSITTYDLASAPPYVALSHTWGPEDTRGFYVTLDGRKHHVRENLYNFVHHFLGMSIRTKAAPDHL
jgi:hypothetical protein